jgi:hypothetical protein
MTETTQGDYLSRSAFGKWLGERVRGKAYTERTLINWELDGKGPPVTRVGRDVSYFLPSAEKWLRAQEKSAAANKAA